MGSDLKVKFWGTRGHISSPRTETIEYGGNTTCIQIMHKNELIIVDTGYGVTNLGEELMERIIAHQENLSIHIFYTHFHWDHIQGLPFFHPIYFPTSEINLYSPWDQNEIHDSLDPLFDGSYSPFAGIKSMPSKINFCKLEQSHSIGDLNISFCPLNHGACESQSFAYRFSDAQSRSIVVAVDHEATQTPMNDGFIEFAKNCDILIHDAQYLNNEYEKFRNWGHSSVKMALENAKKINPHLTLLAHHDPQSDDRDIEAEFKTYSESSDFADLKFEFARELKIYSK